LSTLLRAPQLDDRLEGAIVHRTSLPGVDVLPGAPTASGVSNLLHSPNLPRALEHFRERYDMVLIDTPPIRYASDARVLGRLTDGVVLVVRAGRTTRDDALAVCQRFAHDGTRVLGVVLNDWKPDADRSEYYRRYSPDGRSPRA
jgi:Mrp family chromosome partitioning ATPase